MVISYSNVYNPINKSNTFYLYNFNIYNLRFNKTNKMKERIEELIKLISEKEKEIEPFKNELHNLRNKQAELVKERLVLADKGEGNFKEEELVFAAYNRCICGAGLAYPINIGTQGYWDCSAILMGKAIKEEQHAGKLPFIFYEIKSEQQPSAHGTTTRPNK